ncbi:MAG: hypothetical protein AAF487_09025 [Bacteroidota bacterium]
MKSELDYTDFEELLPEGKYILASNSDFIFENDLHYLFNTGDLRLKDHPDKKRFAGCCGPGDLDALNQICPTCNVEVGTLIAECVWPMFIGLMKDAVTNKSMW